MNTATLYGAGLSRPVVSQRPRRRLNIDVLEFLRPCALLLAVCTLPPLLLPIFALAALFVVPCLPLLVPLWLLGAPRDARPPGRAATAVHQPPPAS